MDTLERDVAAEAEPAGKLPRLVAALIGVLAVAAALAAGHFVAGFVGPTASPFLAVGNSAIDLTPEFLKSFAIRTFGSNDKLVLLSGMAVFMVLVAVVAGLLSRRRVLPGLVIAGALGLVAIVAVLNRPDGGQLAVLAPIASLAAAVGVFRWLHLVAVSRFESDSAEAQGLSRRKFLYSSAGVAVGAGVLGGAGQFLAGRVDVEGSRSGVGPLKPKVPAPAIPNTADFSSIGSSKFMFSILFIS